MNELIKVTYSNDRPVVSARELHDKSPYSSKEVPSFRYKECVVDKLREILAEM